MGKWFRGWVVASILIFSLLPGINAFAAGEALNAVIEKAYVLWTKKNYDEALTLLEPYRKNINKNGRGLYVSGLCKLSLKDYDDAIHDFNASINLTGSASPESAKAYYFLGLTYFYKGDFENAQSSFEVSQDVSADPKLDRMLDIQIEKSIRFREYYESHKSGSFRLFVGLGYQKDVLGLSEEYIDVNPAGVVANFGLSVGYRVIDKFDLVVEPTLFYSDKKTFDRSLLPEKKLQALDVLQAGLSVPALFNLENNSGVQYNVSLNHTVTYSPNSSYERELYLNTTYIVGRILADLSKTTGLDFSVTTAIETGKKDPAPGSDLSGTRIDLFASLRNFTSEEYKRAWTFEIFHSSKQAKSTSLSYKVTKLKAGHQFYNFGLAQAGLEVGYELLNYEDREPARQDKKTVVELPVIQVFSPSLTGVYRAGWANNLSSDPYYQYSDTYVGMQLYFNLGF